MDSPDIAAPAAPPPWLSLAASVDTSSPISGMIEPVERLMLYWAARDFWQGDGEIVEIGCFAGLSTSFLAKGMRDNPAAVTKHKRLHVFDLFQIPGYNTAYYCQLLGLAEDYRGSFQQVFERNIAPYADSIAIHPGDLMARSWQGRPIEIVFLDCAETEEFFDHVFRSFFRSLIPGRSLIILQDFFYHRSYFLPLFLMRFAAHLEQVGIAGTSLVLRHTRPFAEDAFGRPTPGAENDMRKALQRSIKMFGGLASPRGGRLAAGFALLEWKCGNLPETMRILQHLNQVNPDVQVKQDVVNVLRLVKQEL